MKWACKTSVHTYTFRTRENNRKILTGHTTNRACLALIFPLPHLTRIGKLVAGEKKRVWGRSGARIET